MVEKREFSILLKYVYFAALSIDDAGSPPTFYTLVSRVNRHLKRVMSYPTPLTTDTRLVTYAAYAANSRSDCDSPDGLDLKHTGKAAYFDQTAGHFISTGRQADINADDKHDAIPNLIANINDCLWTERTPTTAV
jgi:hypothetical protein